MGLAPSKKEKGFSFVLFSLIIIFLLKWTRMNERVLIRIVGVEQNAEE